MRHNQARQEERTQDGGDYGRLSFLQTRLQASDCGAASLFTPGSNIKEHDVQFHTWLPAPLPGNMTFTI